MKKLTLCFCIVAIAQLSCFAQTVTLTASNYGGYNVRCFGGNNGSVTANVTGGTPPYTYLWSNGATTAGISNLRQGYVSVRVDDANAATPAVIREITLTEPGSLVINLTPYLYPNQRNISCYGCSNGSVTTVVTGGVAPYTYIWQPSNVTVQNPANLGAGDNMVTVTDANNCTTNSGRNLSQPDKVDWTMTGNSGTNPATQFLGTTDNVDFVFKTNGSERMRLKGSGEVKMNSLAGSGYRLMMTDADGVVKPFDKAIAPNLVPWNTRGNDNIDDAFDFIGPKNNKDFVIKTGDYYALPQSTLVERMRITKTGRVCIGTTNPTEKFEIAHSDQYGGMVINQTSAQYYTSEIKFNYQGDQKWAMGCFLGSGANHSFFVWNHDLFNSAFFINGSNNNTGIDTDQPTAKLDVNGSMRIRGLSGNGNKLVQIDNNGNVSANSTDLSNLNLWQTVSGTNIYNNTGKVFIGMNNCPTGNCAGTLYKLYVDGGIMTRDVKVTAATVFPDYVFEKDYKLMGIYELEAYLQKHKHLPEIPSASEVAVNDGFEVGDMQTKLLKKIEEQTLYIISLQKQIDELKLMVISNKK